MDQNFTVDAFRTHDLGLSLELEVKNENNNNLLSTKVVRGFPI